MNGACTCKASIDNVVNDLHSIPQSTPKPLRNDISKNTYPSFIAIAYPMTTNSHPMPVGAIKGRATFKKEILTIPITLVLHNR